MENMDRPRQTKARRALWSPAVPGLLGRLKNIMSDADATKTEVWTLFSVRLDSVRLDLYICSLNQRASTPRSRNRRRIAAAVARETGPPIACLDAVVIDGDSSGGGGMVQRLAH
ncbi:hypothetical protein SEVIR_5G131066v4 [Setaria viridis]